MASQQTSINASMEADVDAEEERKSNEQAVAKLNDFLRRYAAANDRKERDTLDERYRIDLSLPMPEYNTKHALAYTAIDAMEPSMQLFALVCEPNSTQRYRLIEALTGFEHRALLQLKASGAVDLSSLGGERFVIIYVRPTGTKVSALIAQKQMSHSPQFLCEHVLTPIVSLLQQFSDMNISHGLINPDNIYFEEMAVLGPCVVEPCGYSQPYLYESVERIQAMPSAKGEGSTAHDYYALAVTILDILHGPEHFAGFTREALIISILREGAYNTLMRDKEVPEIFYDFLRGTLTQSPEDRWNERQLKNWLDGKRYNVLPPPPPSDAVRPFEFRDMHASTRRELAHIFASNWEEMIVALQSNQLAHWVSVSLRNKELADTIGRMSKTVIEVHTKNETQTGELLMNIVLLLDPQGPIRIRHMAMHIDGIDTMCADLYMSKSHQELQFLAKFIETNMVNYWLTLQSKRDSEYKIPLAINTLVIKLDRLRTYIRNSGYGFGLERMLYDLNPNMPCMSTLFANRHITSLPQMLKQLDRMSPTLPGDDILDRHISAFIANKLGISNEVHLHELTSLPALATNRSMMALYLLGMVQERVETMRLPGLTHWLSIRMMPLMDTIHSRTLRHKLKALLVNLAPLGFAQKMAELLITADYAETDQHGFQQALATYQHNAAEIVALQTPERLERESLRMGLNMATLLAYAGLSFSLFIIVRGVMS